MAKTASWRFGIEKEREWNMIGHQGGEGPPNRRGCWGGGMYETDGNISVCTVQVDFELFGEFEQAEPLTSYSPPRMIQ